jgi:exodeoxyribonuclease VII large subunit
MFAGRARAAGFTPEQGQQVVITARVELYEPSGRLTLNVERIEPVGAGVLELQLRKLVAELREAGWLDPARKRPLPSFPRRVAIVTSRKGAALQDVLDTMRKRCPAVDACLVDVLVQGQQAAPAIAHAIDWLSQHHQHLAIDAILVTRGGGSIEDLWAFNEREVARAIHECRVPVVAAIGHETDTTLAELVADLRCATPTQAAMALTPDRAALTQQNVQVARRLAILVRRTVATSKDAHAAAARALTSALRQRLSTSAQALAQRSARLERGRPAAVYERRRAQLRQSAARLQGVMAGALQSTLTQHTALHNALVAATRDALTRRARDLAAAARQLQLIGPDAVLRRGYSITIGPAGQVVRAPGDVAPGQSITTRLAEGEVQSVVGQSLIVPLPTPRKRKPKLPLPATGPTLFSTSD